VTSSQPRILEDCGKDHQVVDVCHQEGSYGD
jgi:hypothetical protein